MLCASSRWVVERHALALLAPSPVESYKPLRKPTCTTVLLQCPKPHLNKHNEYVTEAAIVKRLLNRDWALNCRGPLARQGVARFCSGLSVLFVNDNVYCIGLQQGRIFQSLLPPCIWQCTKELECLPVGKREHRLSGGESRSAQSRAVSKKCDSVILGIRTPENLVNSEFYYLSQGNHHSKQNRASATRQLH